MRSFRFIVSAVALVAAPSIELPPLAPEGRRVVVHGGAHSWWIDGLPPQTVAQAPGETLLLAFEEPETRERFAEYFRSLHLDGAWSVIVLEPYDGDGHGTPCSIYGTCSGCTWECGPALLCGEWMWGDSWYYRASPAVVRAERKPPVQRVNIPACWGERLMHQYCIACHSTGPAQRPAPSFGEPFRLDGTRQLQDGRRVTTDKGYIRRALLEPQSELVIGYEDVRMPEFRFSDGQIHAMTAFLLETPKQRELRECPPLW